MPLEKGSIGEILVQLVHIYERAHHKNIGLYQLWEKIVEYHDTGGGHRFYILCEYDKSRPHMEFMHDMVQLRNQGFLKQDNKKGFGLTPIGRSFVLGRCLPGVLRSLELRLEQ